MARVLTFLILLPVRPGTFVRCAAHPLCSGAAGPAPPTSAADGAGRAARRALHSARACREHAHLVTGPPRNGGSAQCGLLLLAGLWSPGSQSPVFTSLELAAASSGPSSGVGATLRKQLLERERQRQIYTESIAFYCVFIRWRLGRLRDVAFP